MYNSPVTFSGAGFSWSILVEDFDVATEAVVNLRGKFRRQRLAAYDEAFDPAVPVIQIFDESEVARSELEHINEVVLHDALNRKLIGTSVNDQTIACEQRG